MSAFVVVVRRDQEPLAKRELDPLMNALDHRGPDGKDTVWLGWAALGHQHFWTTPEEVGEKQPLHDPKSGVYVLLDGRLDNREEIANSLQIDREQLPCLSDAALILRAFHRWGESCFTRLLGPFAVVAIDSKTRRVICARDPLGGRTLFFFCDAGILILASEESALLAHPSISSRLNESTLARFYALKTPLPGTTFFSDIHELPAAHAMVVEGDRVRTWRHWHPDSVERPHLQSELEFVERFRDLLSQSVRCRMRAVAPPAVLMSGGMDSTSVAALAARQVDTAGPSRPLRTISWYFDELSSCDEREYIQPVVDRLHLDSVLIPADDTWPLRDLTTWPSNPNTPLQNLYRRLIFRAYRTVRDSGTVTVLTGADGDWLYSGEQYWLRDLLFDGRLVEASKLVAGELVHRPAARLGGAAWLRGSVSRAIGRRRRESEKPEWLTDYALDQVGEDPSPPDGPLGRPEQTRELVGDEAAYWTSQEIPNASHCGIEVRRPYRDRRLVEFMLATPAYFLYRGGWRKWIMRSAMVDILPEPVRLRWKGTSLTPLCVRGLVEREGHAVRHLLEAKKSMWPEFVRPEWMRRVVTQGMRENCTEILAAWNCISMELWLAASEGWGRAKPLRGATKS